MNEKLAEILGEFKRNGGRITKQRKNLLDVILTNPDSTCKEIYYFARQKNSCIGMATVYRTVKKLENMGYISKHNVAILS